LLGSINQSIIIYTMLVVAFVIRQPILNIKIVIYML